MYNVLRYTYQDEVVFSQHYELVASFETFKEAVEFVNSRPKQKGIGYFVE